MEGPLNVQGDPEVAAVAAVVVVAQEDRCGQGLEDLVAASRQVEELERQLHLDPRVVAVDLGLVEDLAGSHRDRQDLPVDWEDPGIDLGAGSAELAPPAAVEGPWLGGSAVAEVPGSCGVDAFRTGAVQAASVLAASAGSPFAGPGHASASPASGHGASLAEHISAAAEVVLSGEAELDRRGAAHRG